MADEGIETGDQYPKLRKKLEVPLGDDSTPLSQAAARNLVEAVEKAFAAEAPGESGEVGIPMDLAVAIALRSNAELTLALHALELEVNQLREQL